MSFDRFHGSPRSQDQDSEDRFCNQLRKIGAKWWESERDWLQARSKARKMTEDEKRVVLVGWPPRDSHGGGGGGVWVLKVPSEEYVPEMGRIWNGFSMGERCRAIEMSGRVFYEDVGDCEDLRDVVGGDGNGRTGVGGELR